MFSRLFARPESKGSAGSPASHPSNTDSGRTEGATPSPTTSASATSNPAATRTATAASVASSSGASVPPLTATKEQKKQLDVVKDAESIAHHLQTDSISSVTIPQYRVAGNYVEYVVECTRGNHCWRLFRRYQQFKSLDQALRQLSSRGTPCHGDYGVLPSLPGSHWMEVTNQSTELVDRRRRFLEIYLQQLLVPNNLFYAARTVLYSFLHDGEVMVDTKAVSVSPLLGLATLDTETEAVPAGRVTQQSAPLPLQTHAPWVSTTTAAPQTFTDPLAPPPPCTNSSPSAAALPDPAPLPLVSVGGVDRASSVSAELTVQQLPATGAQREIASPTSTDSLGPQDEVTAWHGDDELSGSDETDAADDGTPLVVPASHCLHCNEEFTSALYPHRCFFCRSRFCRKCLWKLHIAAKDGVALPAKLQGRLEEHRRAEVRHDPTARAAAATTAGAAARTGEVNACLQCAENYMRRWKRYHGSGGPQPVAARVDAETSPLAHALPSPGETLVHSFWMSSSAAVPLRAPVDCTTSPTSSPASSAPLAVGSLRQAAGPASPLPPLISPALRPMAGALSAVSPVSSNASAGKLSVTAKPLPVSVGLDDFRLLTVLGRGTFGKVIKVRLRATETDYAMKVLSKSVVYKRYMTSYIKEEKNILTSLPPHPYVVHCHFAFQSDYYLFFILDYLPGGELYDLIYPTLRLSAEEARLYTAELVLAVEHIHRYDVVHRDIKPENIVLGADGHLKLTDFGLARKNFSHTRRRSFVGSAEYVSPETIQGECQTPAVDWWSIGVLLYEMLKGKAPFHAPNNNAVYDNVLHKELDFTESEAFSPGAISLIQGLLERDPHARLQDAETIRAHPFFHGVDWSALYHKAVPAPRQPYLEYNDTRHFKRDFTAQWASVPPPAHLSSRISIDALNKCFDNFPVVRMRREVELSAPSTAAAAATTATAAATTGARQDAAQGLSPVEQQLATLSAAALSAHDSVSNEPLQGTQAGTLPPPLSLESGGGSASAQEATSTEARTSTADACNVEVAGTTKTVSQASLPTVSFPSPRGMSSLAGRAPQQGTAEDLLGVWKLLKVEVVAMDGRVIYPWGGDVMGLLVYLPSGDFSMQLAPQRRRQLRCQHISHASKEELRDLYCSYVAQFGVFAVGEPDATQGGLAAAAAAGEATSNGAASDSSADGEPNDVPILRECTTPVTHWVEGNFCPNLSQRVAVFRFGVRQTSLPTVRAATCVLDSPPPSTHSPSPTDTGPAEERAFSSYELPEDDLAITATRPPSRTVLHLATEPKAVPNETFRAQTVLSWIRVGDGTALSRAACTSPE